VLGTEAVVHRLPHTKTPKENVPGMSGHWADNDWTYGEAMAHVIDRTAGTDTLVDMESYGIATTTRALGLGERVIGMRVATDALKGKKTDKLGGGQGRLLLSGRLALMHLLAVLLELT
jgi:hypothetical protein